MKVLALTKEVEMIIGENESRFPFSTSLFIKSKEGDTLIDCGGGPNVYEYVKQNLKQIFLTHYHHDHTNGISRFSDKQIFINPYDFKRLIRMDEKAKKNPSKMSGGVAQLIYPYHHTLTLSGVRVVMLHTPGHCEGYCCPYFPDLGIILVGDYDLSSFGPWYFDPDGDIDWFVESARKTLEIDAKYYVTSHQKGMVLKSEYETRLAEFLNIIDRRDKMIKRAIREGITPNELIWQDIIYFRKVKEQRTAFLRFEKNAVAKHLKRMIRNGEPYQDYFEEFLAVHHLDKDQIDVFTQPEWVG